jgi:AcrR family transcriptional regulator
MPPEQRKREFVRKAVEFFAEVGFDGGTRELAKRLGVTQPLLYRYFPNKQSLVREVYKTVYLNRWRPEWDELLLDRSRPLRERLEKFYQEYTNVIFSHEWMRIYFFAGLKGVEINALYLEFVEQQILKRIIREIRHEAGMPEGNRVSPEELELAWFLQGGIFYYGVRKHIYAQPVLEDKSDVIARALAVFIEGMESVFRQQRNGEAVEQPRASRGVARATGVTHRRALNLSR